MKFYIPSKLKQLIRWKYWYCIPTHKIYSAALSMEILHGQQSGSCFEADVVVS